jgi:hypothetical protein
VIAGALIQNIFISNQKLHAYLKIDRIIMKRIKNDILFSSNLLFNTCNCCYQFLNISLKHNFIILQMNNLIEN